MSFSKLCSGTLFLKVIREHTLSKQSAKIPSLCPERITPRTNGTEEDVDPYIPGRLDGMLEKPDRKIKDLIEQL